MRNLASVIETIDIPVRIEGAGQAGRDGHTILNGIGAPASTLGTNGDFYIDTAVYDLYGPKTAGGWGSSISLIGSESEALWLEPDENGDLMPRSTGLEEDENGDLMPIV